MTSANDLYSELKPDVAAVANLLFELSEKLISKTGNFFPHGAVLTDGAEVKLVAAAPPGGTDLTNSIEILPVLHDGLRTMASEVSCKAIGIAENVTVTPEGQRPTAAIKVLFEHRRGLCVALYLPFKKKLFGGYSFGQPFTVAANPEVNAWPVGDA